MRCGVTHGDQLADHCNVPVTVMLTESVLSPDLFSHQYAPPCDTKEGLIFTDPVDVSYRAAFEGTFVITLHSAGP